MDINDDSCEAFDVQRSQHNQLSRFSRQLAYMLAQITDGAARAIVSDEDTDNGLEIVGANCTSSSHCQKERERRIR